MSSAEPTPHSPVSHRTFVPRKRTWKNYVIASVLLLLAVVAGGVIGAGVAVFYFRDGMYPKPMPPEEMRKYVVNRMESLFEVKAQEKEQIDNILDKHMDEIGRLRKEFFEAIRVEFNGMRDEINTVLGPERAQKWEADRKKRHDDRHRPRDVGGPGNRGEGGGSGGNRAGGHDSDHR